MVDRVKPWFMVHGSDFSVSPSPLGTDLTRFDWVGAGLRGFGFWHGA